MTGVRKRKSKLEPFADQLGVRPDAEVAELAGVRSETVRSYRIRHGIEASWRSASSDGSSPVPGNSARKRAFRGRRSRLDPYRALLGQLTDREVAKKAGVTTENVRAYRNRRGIPAVRPGSPRTSSPSVKLASSVLSAAPAGQRWAYKVRVQVGSASREYVVVGSSMGEAARIAEDRLGAMLPGAVLVELAVVGEAL